MTSELPTSLPPAHLQPRIIPILLRRLSSIPLSEYPILIPLLEQTTRILAYDKLHYGNLSSTTTVPLQIALHLCASPLLPELPLPLLLDLTTSYPAHRAAIFSIWSHSLSISPPSNNSPQEEMDSEDEGETVLGNLIQTEFLPTIISKLQQKPSVADVTICSTMLLGLIRAHEELLAILLSEADYVIPALRTAYTVLSGATSTDEVEGGLKKEAVRAKESILLFCAELVRAVRSESVREGLRGLAQVPGGMKVSEKMSGFLGKNSMGEDLGVYLAFELGSEKVEGGIDGSISQVLEQIADDDARGDPRVQAILALFPTLPPAQLLLALNHPSYATSSTSAPEIQASPLLEVILSGGSSLPSELTELRHAVQAVSEHQSSISIAPPSPPPIATASSSTTTPYVRANIHDTPLDMSRLTIRSGVDEPTPLALAPGVGKDVSDEMRAKIHRLVERQRVEAEELAKAIEDAGGPKYRPERQGYEDGMEGDVSLAMVDDDDEDLDEDDLGVGAGVKGRVLATAREGDESGEEENGENIVHTPKPQKGKPEKAGYDVTIQTKLELAYLADVRVFDRDGTTRRSVARAKLRTATGMDDSQLEGWRIMLDRNIHKEAILGRHTFVPSQNLDYVMDGQSSDTRSQSSRGGGGGRGRGGIRGGGSQRGGGEDDASSIGGDSMGGRSNHGGGGGSRGRGENKGNRGHSNAARTRGHDKKMSRMGAGA